MTIALSVLLAAALAWYILKPLSWAALPAGASPEGNSHGLMESKERLIQMLRDLELDFATAKLSDDEYNGLKNELSVELAGILEELDKLGNTR